ncbi:MAG TPA: hypothetical protein VJ870_07780 [Amycolatopsis sp.]|nr:hypothetical protein [Amycolatopsis sp.]
MDADEARTIAFRCHRALDPLHSTIYFAPEADDHFAAIGLRPGRMTYFASRSAPLGRPGPATVAATFYNFNPELVARYIPRAWTLAEPARILDARFELADLLLRRLLGDTVATPEVAEAAGLAREAADGCTPEGRPLYAGHAELEWPKEPHVVLWHAATLLREYRGDGHIAALVANGVGALPALITHTATGRGFAPAAAKALRGWSEDEWAAAVAGLREDGVLDAGGGLTADGQALRDRIEDQTNAAAVAPWRRLGAEKAARLADLGRMLSRAVVEAGAYPEGIFAAPRS